jgi:hypothetical protein
VHGGGYAHAHERVCVGNHRLLCQLGREGHKCTRTGLDCVQLYLCTLSLEQTHCVPVISAAATSPELDDANMYPLFTRTCSSDHYHADMIVQLLMNMNWRRVSIFYESDSFGVGMKTQFESLLLDYRSRRARTRCVHSVCSDDICVDAYFEVDYNALNIHGVSYTAVQQLNRTISAADHRVHVIVLFLQPATATVILHHMQKCFAAQDVSFQIVWADGATTRRVCETNTIADK